MKSIRSLQLVLIVAVLVFIVLLVTDIFTIEGAGWWEGVLAGVIVALALLVAYRRLTVKSERTGTIKRLRDSLLKWRWEDRQRREW